MKTNLVYEISVPRITNVKENENIHEKLAAQPFSPWTLLYLYYFISYKMILPFSVKKKNIYIYIYT